MSKVLPIVVVLLLAVGCRNESQMTPAFIGVSSAQSEPANYYLPAGFVIQPNESEPDVYEYY